MYISAVASNVMLQLYVRHDSHKLYIVSVSAFPHGKDSVCAPVCVCVCYCIAYILQEPHSVEIQAA